MNEMTQKEKNRRRDLVHYMRTMIRSILPIFDEDETSLMLEYHEFCLQISFSATHPLMVFTFAHPFKQPYNLKLMNNLNKLNHLTVLGCHILNGKAQCYSHRSTHWIDTEISESRFNEMLERCYIDAISGFSQLSG